MKSMEWQWSVEEGRIKVALDEVYQQHSKRLDKIQATISPIASRSLQAKAAIGKDQLVLVPLTTTIYLKKLDDVYDGVLLKTYKDMKNSKFNVILSRCIKIPKAESATGIGGLKEQPGMLLVPFWLVKDPLSDGSANLALKYISPSCYPELKIPVFTNKVDIAEGDVIYGSVAPKPKAKAKASTAPPAKKART